MDNRSELKNNIDDVSGCERGRAPIDDKRKDNIGDDVDEKLLREDKAQDDFDYWLLSNLPLKESQIPTMLEAMNVDRLKCNLKPLSIYKFYKLHGGDNNSEVLPLERPKLVRQ